MYCAPDNPNKYFDKQNFRHKKNNKKFKPRGKFKYYSKSKKNYPQNKKVINY